MLLLLGRCNFPQQVFLCVARTQSLCVHLQFEKKIHLMDKLSIYLCSQFADIQVIKIYVHCKFLCANFFSLYFSMLGGLEFVWTLGDGLKG